MGLSIVRNRLKRLKELFYRSDGSLESYLRKGFRLSVRFCPNSPFAPFTQDRFLELTQAIECVQKLRSIDKTIAGYWFELEGW